MADDTRAPISDTISPLRPGGTPSECSLDMTDTGLLITETETIKREFAQYD